MSTQCLPYSVPNHELITRSAAALIEQCQGSPLDEKLVQTYVDYNLAQDKLLKKRLMWHFDRATGNNTSPKLRHRDDIYKSMAVLPDFSLWYSYLSQQIALQNTGIDRAPAIGAMLHFVQDMAVPAHVVPIFHPSRLMNRDNFDEWYSFNLDSQQIPIMGYAQWAGDDTAQPTAGVVYLDEVTKKDVCDTLKSSKELKPAQILSKLKEDTKAAINSPIKHYYVADSYQGPYQHSSSQQDTAKQRWSLLWPSEGEYAQDLANDGFSYYGCDVTDKDQPVMPAKNKRGGGFGDHKLRCGNKVYVIDPIEYRHFATERITDAITASAQLMINGQQLALSTDTAKSKCQQEKWVVTKRLLECLKHEAQTGQN
ncbi:hypothetical protein [Sinobacterium norvegicum]|nr:hypothetical protein [Sinobacterium norvegicum]